MAQILAFAGSNSSTSINLKLVKHTVSLIHEHHVDTLDMVNYPFPMYSIDIEKTKGFSNSLVELKDDIQKASGLVLSVNEHNGNPSAYFKNTLDWLSRIDRKFLADTKILLMSTSVGKQGGTSSLEVVNAMIPRFGGEVFATFSLPEFAANFDGTKGITNEALAMSHKAALNSFLKSL
jgi:NAD(P)H-dependent FMN reductase